MHIKRIQAKGFKRFTNLDISDIPPKAKLVVLIGPNGSGKSSLFDAMQLWRSTRHGRGSAMDETYGPKKCEVALPPGHSWFTNDTVTLHFHEELSRDRNVSQKVIYIRSAFRHEPDFRTDQLQRTGSVFEAPRIDKLIDSDTKVSDNYRRLVSATIDGVYDGQRDSLSVPELRDSYIGPIRESMQNVFESLILRGPGDPLKNGTFYFEKGVSRDFHYKNLSAGEKAAFDILLDFFIKRDVYNDTVFCIDEPELHMHSSLQGRLLQELLRIIPDSSQLWIATHSIGMLRKARDIQQRNPEEVAFIDFHDRNFDEPVILRPVEVSRPFWQRMLSVALDDLADLVAPKLVVLCEGRPPAKQHDPRSEFDAKCYRVIFATQFPDTDFISVGNGSDVRDDRLEVGKSIKSLISGTSVVRVMDRDDLSVQQVQELTTAGVRVLRRRHLEAYLLDDEILTAYCVAQSKPDDAARVVDAKRKAIAESVARNNAEDDHKSAAGALYNEIRKILQLKASGSDAHAFMRDNLAPLVLPETRTYQELCRDVFDE